MGSDIMSKIYKMGELAFTFSSSDGFEGSNTWIISDIYMEHDRINIYSDENAFSIYIEEIDMYSFEDGELIIKMKKGGDIILSPI